MTMKSNYPLSRKTDLVIQELENEILIYDLIKERALCLNETSAFVWQAADGRKSIGEISRLLSAKFETTANKDIVWLALDQLKKENLIANDANIPDTFNNMSRRQIVKRVGLASMVALPLVVSIVAPS